MCAASKSAAVVFAGLEPGAPRASIGGHPTHIHADIRFILHPKLVSVAGLATENKSATASTSWQDTTYPLDPATPRDPVFELRLYWHVMTASNAYRATGLLGDAPLELRLPRRA